MRHSTAVAWLADYVEQTLPPPVLDSLRLHVDGCRRCRDWIAAYEAMRELIESPSTARHADHPSSSDLAVCVSRPEELAEPDRAGLQAHVYACSRCREDLSLLRQAVLGARPSNAVVDNFLLLGEGTTRDRSSLGSRRLLVAAGVLVLALPLALVVRGTLRGSNDSDNRQHFSAGARPDVVERLEDLTLSGERHFVSDEAIVVSRVQVGPGSQVTLQARDNVQLKAGFKIGRGASLAVTLDDEAPSASRPTHRNRPKT
jgi:hypothetical protein